MSGINQRLCLHPSAECFPERTSLDHLSLELCKQPTGCSLLSSPIPTMTYVLTLISFDRHCFGIIRVLEISSSCKDKGEIAQNFPDIPSQLEAEIFLGPSEDTSSWRWLSLENKDPCKKSSLHTFSTSVRVTPGKARRLLQSPLADSCLGQEENWGFLWPRCQPQGNAQP